MALRDLTDEELLDEIRSMEAALRQYNDEVERRVLGRAGPLRRPQLTAQPNRTQEEK